MILKKGNVFLLESKSHHLFIALHFLATLKISHFFYKKLSSRPSSKNFLISGHTLVLKVSCFTEKNSSKKQSVKTRPFAVPLRLIDFLAHKAYCSGHF